MDPLKMENENMALKQKAIALKIEYNAALEQIAKQTVATAVLQQDLSKVRSENSRLADDLAICKTDYLKLLHDFEKYKVSHDIRPQPNIIVVTSGFATERTAIQYLQDFKISCSNEQEARAALIIARAANPMIAAGHLYNDVPVWYRRIILSELAGDDETRRRINNVWGSDELNTFYRKLKN